MQIKEIAVHDGTFHSDDVFAAAIITLVYPDSKIVRTRDPDELEKADMRIDVGRKYDIEKGDFDHHQKEFTRKRENGIPYASAGLIWESFYDKLVDTKEEFEYIDKKLIQPIDAHDNGMSLLNGPVKPYTLQKVINTFFPDWKEDNPDYDKGFNEAVKFAQTILKKEIENAKDLKDAKEVIKNKVVQTDKEYLVLDKEMPQWGEIIYEYPQIKYVIWERKNGTWSSTACRREKDSFESIKPFPKEWADLNDEKFANLTGVKDAVFCHKALFLVVANSKEGIIKLTEMSLKN